MAVLIRVDLPGWDGGVWYWEHEVHGKIYMYVYTDILVQYVSYSM